jgi:hypothetical protein
MIPVTRRLLENTKETPMTIDTPKAALPTPKAKRSFYGNRPDLAAMAKISRILEEFDPATAGRILDMLRMGLPNQQMTQQQVVHQQQTAQPSSFAQRAMAAQNQQQGYFQDAD